MNALLVLMALEAAAPWFNGNAAQMACTVLPLLMTVQLTQRRPSLHSWLPLSSVMVMVLRALEAAAPFWMGTAALMVSTVLPLLMTAHLPSIKISVMLYVI